MQRKFLLTLLGAALVSSTACDSDGDSTSGNAGGTEEVNDDEDPPETTETTQPTDTADPSATSGPEPTDTTPETTGPDPSDSDSDSDTDDDNGFIAEPDGGGVAVECDVWEEDCPEGEKCMPWANDGGSSWNATKCSPLDDAPGQIGETCTVEGSGVSGVDSCDARSMCYYVDPETSEGVCVGFCEGSQQAPTCDTGFICTIVNDGVLTLCRPECDPIQQDCDGTAACLPATGSDGFTCIIDASGESGAAGDPCEFINACDPGLYCSNPELVPDCVSGGCCTNFCDLGEKDALCPGTDQECIPWFEEGATPPGLEHVGACALPTG